MMRRSYLFVCLMALTPFYVQAVTEPDDDHDGVSNYDDYCPTTPAGLPVWTMEHYRSGRALRIEWVGCAGENNGDSVQPGYTPPQRPVPPPLPPEESTGFKNTKALFDDGIGFNFQESVGWYSGRCWNSSVEEPSNQLLWIESRAVGGPAFPSTNKFGGLFWFRKPADAWDEPENEEGRRETLEVINKGWLGYNEAQPEEKGFSIFNREASVTLELKKSADNAYFVMKRGGSRDVQRYCYFFKKVF